jgi:para-aminobenzoate synthetase component 1
VTPLAGGDDVPRLLRALADRPGLAVLDSAGGAPRRFSLVAFEPLAEALVGPLPRDVAGLRAYVAQLAPEGAHGVPGPFAGGFVGALAYDLGVAGEGLELPQAAWANPQVVGGLYTDFVVIEHTRHGEHGPHGAGGEAPRAPDRAWLVLGAGDVGDRPDVATRRASVERALADAPEVGDPRLPASRARGLLRRLVPTEEHLCRVRAVQAHIGRGECYQANLAHRYERDVEGHPVALYLRLRELAPAPYMGLVRWPASAASTAGPGWSRGALLSASPELLLEVDVAASGARRARTRPIKGTAPRGLGPAEDAAQRAALLASAKDRAELAMIVDLERNDLARVAVPGTVGVAGFPTVETYRSVHHLVADVTATLRAECDAVDALAALFPGGSITGAPKLASMEVIAALEGEGRGFFCGALGALDCLGRARFNILIRTLVHRAEGQPAHQAPSPDLGTVTFHVGGGITWRSDPAAEERETRVKGATLAAALGGVDQPVDTLGAILADPEPGPPETTTSVP